MIKVQINPNAKIEELAEILVKLRHKTKVWEVGYGWQKAQDKKTWEKKADDWIDENIIQF